jgi:hypothetical protein
MNPLRSSIGKLFTKTRRSAKVRNRTKLISPRLEGLEDRTTPSVSSGSIADGTTLPFTASSGEYVQVFWDYQTADPNNANPAYLGFASGGFMYLSNEGIGYADMVETDTFPAGANPLTVGLRDSTATGQIEVRTEGDLLNARFTNDTDLTVAEGQSFSLKLTTTDFWQTPTIAPSVTSPQLPDGVKFKDNGDGTATISGTAKAGTAGTYNLDYLATSGAQGTGTFFNLTVTGGATGDIGIKSVKPSLDFVAAPGEPDVITVSAQNKSANSFNIAAGAALITIFAVDANNTKYKLGEYDAPSSQTLKPGQSFTDKVKFDLPDLGDADLLPVGKYVYEADLSPALEGKVGTSTSQFDFEYKFGNVDGKNIVAKVRQGAIETTYSLKGAGTGTISLNGEDVDVSLDDTNKSTKVSAQINGLVSPLIHDISASADVGEVDFANLDANGSLDFSGALRKLTLGNFGGGTDSELSINAGANPTLQFRAITDANITSKAGITSLTADSWKNTDLNKDTLTATYIGNLTIDGDFDADVDITGPSPTGYGIGSASINGSIHNSIWTIGSAGSLNAKKIAIENTFNSASDVPVNFAHNWHLDVSGDIGGLQVPGWENSGTSGPAIDADSIGVALIGDTSARDATHDLDSIVVNGASSKGIAIGSLNLIGSDSSPASIAINAPAGGISGLQISGPEIDVTAKWISILSGGDLSGNLTLTGAGPGKSKTSLGRASVSDITGGTWNLFGDISSLQVFGSVNNWTLNGGQGANSPGTKLGSLIVGDISGGDLLGTIQNVAGLGQGSINGTFGGTISTTAQGAIGRFNALKVDNGKLNAQSIQTISVKDWASGTVTAGDLGTLKVAGDLTNATLNLSPSGERTTLIVAGDINGLDATVAGNVGFNSITAKNWNSGTINGSQIKSLELTGDMTGATLTLTKLGALTVGGAMSQSSISAINGIGNLTAGAMRSSTISTQKTIESLSTAGIAGSTAPFFDSTNVTAQTIDFAVVRNVNETAGGGYGISADVIDDYRRYSNGSLVKKLAHLLVADPAADQAGDFTLKIG